MDAAHGLWRTTRGDPTSILKRCVWDIGFEFRHVYPSAHGLDATADDFARNALGQRGARFWGSGEEHSPVKEFQYDVAWVEYADEYRGDEVPQFKRLVLALESEFSREWEVVLDFHKLLCARADLRVMVWYPTKFASGHQKLQRRIRDAGEWGEGQWLLSAWGDGGFTHRCYPELRTAS
jgi:hypothetical protein